MVRRLIALEGAGGRKDLMSKVATEAGYSHEGLLLREQPAEYYRTTADRYRELLAETTTLGLKVLDLKERLRCRGCGAKGRAVVSIKWRG
jgi:hypothetical protein